MLFKGNVYVYKLWRQQLVKIREHEIYKFADFLGGKFYLLISSVQRHLFLNAKSKTQYPDQIQQ